MITVASIVKNEVSRFLEPALASWQQFADRIVVLDDGSTDESAEMAREMGCEVHSEPVGMFGEEWKARKRLYELATEGAEWVIWLDADQTLSSDPAPHLVAPMVAFRVFDLWSADTYRADAWWQGHRGCWWRAIHAPSYAGMDGKWAERGWHSGHLPVNQPGPVHPTPIECSVLHYAYSSPELRAQKAAMYEALGPHLTPEERFNAGTITAPNPPTRELPMKPMWPLL